MAIAGRRQRLHTSRPEQKWTAEAADQADHEAAIERLRAFAERGLDDPALDGLDDTDFEPVVPSPATAKRAMIDCDTGEQLRVVEALIFASPQPLSENKISEYLPAGTDVAALIEALAESYAGRGIELVRVAGKWSFRTAGDLAYLLEKYAVEERRLSKAALETLAIIAYHQPVTRAEIEEIRGVQTSRGTLDVLMETTWIRPRGRRRAPGKPITYGTTDAFLSHFGLDALGDLPGLADLKGAGLLDSDLPPDFAVPSPKEVAALMPDELPLDEDGDAADAELDLGEQETGEGDPAADSDETDGETT